MEAALPHDHHKIPLEQTFENFHVAFIIQTGFDFDLADGIRLGHKNAAQGPVLDQGDLGDSQGVVVFIGRDTHFDKTAHTGVPVHALQQQSQADGAGGRIHDRRNPFHDGFERYLDRLRGNENPLAGGHLAGNSLGQVNAHAQGSEIPDGEGGSARGQLLAGHDQPVGYLTGKGSPQACILEGDPRQVAFRLGHPPGRIHVVEFLLADDPFIHHFTAAVQLAFLVGQGQFSLAQLDAFPVVLQFPQDLALFHPIPLFHVDLVDPSAGAGYEFHQAVGFDDRGRAVI